MSKFLENGVLSNFDLTNGIVAQTKVIATILHVQESPAFRIA